MLNMLRNWFCSLSEYVQYFLECRIQIDPVIASLYHMLLTQTTGGFNFVKGTHVIT